MWDRDYMYEQDIALIMKYIRTRRKKVTLKGESYSCWAIDEILNRVWIETQKLPYHVSGMEPEPVVDIIREFVEEMDYYSDLATTEELIYFTLTAKDEAEQLLHKFERR